MNEDKNRITGLWLAQPFESWEGGKGRVLTGALAYMLLPHLLLSYSALRSLFLQDGCTALAWAWKRRTIHKINTSERKAQGLPFFPGLKSISIYAYILHINLFC